MIPTEIPVRLQDAELNKTIHYMMENGFSHPNGRSSWSNDDLIQESGLARGTFFNLTKGRRVRRNTLERVLHCFFADLDPSDARVQVWRDHTLERWHLNKAHLEDETRRLLKIKMVEMGAIKRKARQISESSEAQKTQKYVLLIELLRAIHLLTKDETLVSATEVLQHGNLPAVKSMLLHIREAQSAAMETEADLNSKLSLALGLIAHEQLNLHEAYRLFEESCQTLPCDTNLQQAGTLAWTIGDFAAAKRYEEEALALAQEKFGRNHEKVAQAHNNLGVTKAAIADFDGAIVEYREALRIRDPMNGGDPASYAKCLNNLAAALIKAGRYKAAIDPCNRAIKTRMELLARACSDEELARSALALSSSLHVEGLLSIAAQDYEKAEESHRRALSLRQQYAGECNLLTAQSYYELARTMMLDSVRDDRVRKLEARDHLTQSISIYAMLVGDFDGVYALRSCVLARAEYDLNGRTTRALTDGQRHIDNLILWLGRWHPDTIEAIHFMGPIETDTK